MNSHERFLRDAAIVMHREGDVAWGNTCEAAADEIRRLTNANAELVRSADAAHAEIERMRAAGVGYSQQTVDALSSERDRLRAALIALAEAAQNERTECALALRSFDIPNTTLKGRIARLDAVIAQADAALGSER